MNSVRIGDRLRVGSAEFVVTQPRIRERLFEPDA